MKTYARIVTAQLKPETINEAVRVLHERVEPSLKQEHGFQSSELLVNRTSGRMAMVSHFDTQSNVQAGGPEHFQERSAMIERFLDSPAQLEIYEVDVTS